MNLPAAEPGVNFIYALYDPRAPEEYRYIGKTDAPKKRLSTHIRGSGAKKFYKGNWVRSIQKSGVQPVMKVLIKVGSDWEFWERRLIKFYREKGHRLTNLTSGGEGQRDASPESRARMGWKRKHNPPEMNKKVSASLKGRVKTPEHRRKLAEANKGKPFTEERKRNISRACKGRIISPDTRKKIGDFHRGRKRSALTRKRMSNAAKGRIISPEQREDIRKTLTGYKHTQEAKKNMSEAQKRNWVKRKAKEANQ